MNTEPQENPVTPPSKSPLTGIKRALIALGILALFMLLFGQLIPRILFPNATQPPAVNKETSAITEDHDARQQIQQMQLRLDQMEARLNAHETLLTSPQASEENTPAPAQQTMPPEDLTRWQASIEEKLAALSSASVASDTASSTTKSIDESRLAALEARINNQQQAFATIQLQADEKVALLMALAQLKEAVSHGSDYAQALQAVAVRLIHRKDLQPALQSLAMHARRGLTTPEQSKARFEPLLRQALEASTKATGGTTLGALVSIRKTGLPEGSTDEAILARAETHLLEGDMEACLRELEALSRRAAEIFAPWVSTARAYRSAQEDVKKLQLAAFSPAPSIAEAPITTDEPPPAEVPAP